MKIRIPGAVWAAGLLIITGFLTAAFPDKEWIPVLVWSAAAILKFLEVQFGEDYPDIPSGPQTRSAGSYPKKPSKLQRWLFE